MNHISNTIIRSWIILLIGLMPQLINALEEEIYSTRLDLVCIQEFDKDIILSAKLRAKEGRSYVPVKGEKISFSFLGEEDYIELGEGTTDEDGDAIIPINNLDALFMDEDGYYTVSATFTGSEKYEENEEEFMFKRGYLEMSTSEEDGKTVTLYLFAVEEGENIPLEEIEARVSVPMLFSNLTIGLEYTDENGEVEYSFPDDLPGDENGKITLMAEANDTYDYGILKASAEKEWGIPKEVVVEESRTLWSPDAPLWMVITFAVLMVAVWGHLIYIIYRLFRLNKVGKSLTIN